MIYNRPIITIIAIILSLKLSAQVTIGSGDPPHKGAVLELKSDNLGFLGPRVQLENLFISDPIQNPARGLLVFNIGNNGTGDGKVEKDKFYFWGEDRWVEFVYEEVLEGEIKTRLDSLGIPRSAVFHLDGKDTIDYSNPAKPILGMFDVMAGTGLGNRKRILLKESNNETNGDVTLAEDEHRNAFIGFNKGTYSITFAYQFIPSVNAYPTPSSPIIDCSASSYFMDFPLENGQVQYDRARIHNVAYHTNVRNQGHHGGAINYAIRIEQESRYWWWVQLGAGQSGPSCNYGDDDLATPGFSLVNDATFLIVTRIGD